jgi:hypothetical protein
MRQRPGLFLQPPVCGRGVDRVADRVSIRSARGKRESQRPCTPSLPSRESGLSVKPTTALGEEQAATDRGAAGAEASDRSAACEAGDYAARRLSVSPGRSLTRRRSPTRRSSTGRSLGRVRSPPCWSTRPVPGQARQRRHSPRLAPEMPISASSHSQPEPPQCSQRESRGGRACSSEALTKSSMPANRDNADGVARGRSKTSEIAGSGRSASSWANRASSQRRASGAKPSWPAAAIRLRIKHPLCRRLSASWAACGASATLLSPPSAIRRRESGPLVQRPRQRRDLVVRC